MDYRGEERPRGRVNATGGDCASGGGGRLALRKQDGEWVLAAEGALGEAAKTLEQIVMALAEDAWTKEEALEKTNEATAKWPESIDAPDRRPEAAAALEDDGQPRVPQSGVHGGRHAAAPGPGARGDREHLWMSRLMSVAGTLPAT